MPVRHGGSGPTLRAVPRRYGGACAKGYVVSSKQKAKVVVVDDHPIVREGLAELINREKDLTVCGDAADVVQAMKVIAESKPDIAIIDISLKDSSGLQLIKRLRGADEKLCILVLSMHDEDLYAERALRAGAQGYIMKREAPREVVSAIRRVLAGEIYVGDELAARFMRRFVGGEPHVGGSPVELLSDRELEVFDFIGQGLKTGQIAERLHLSVKTIESYREHIKEKLGLRNATELVQHAIKWVHEDTLL